MRRCWQEDPGAWHANRAGIETIRYVTQGPDDTGRSGVLSPRRTSATGTPKPPSPPLVPPKIIATTAPRRSTTGPPLSPGSTEPRSGTTRRGRTRLLYASGARTVRGPPAVAAVAVSAPSRG